MIRIRVKGYTILREYLGEASPDGYVSLEVPEGSTVAGLLQSLNLPDSKVMLVFVNGQQAQWSTTLREGDKVELLAPISGGEERP